MYWVTGRPGCGKTTFSKELSSAIDKFFKTKRTVILDGDEIRKHFVTEFTYDGRKENLIRAVKFANLLEEQDMIVICAFVSPTTELRELVRNLANKFIPVYIPNIGADLWPGTTYDPPIISENPNSPEDILSLYK